MGNVADDDDGQRVRYLERELAVLAERLESSKHALSLQAIEYERRLDGLNGEAVRIGRILDQSVTSEKFADYLAASELRREAALSTNELVHTQHSDRLTSLEQWRSKTLGVATVLVLVSATVGAAIDRVLGF